MGGLIVQQGVGNKMSHYAIAWEAEVIKQKAILTKRVHGLLEVVDLAYVYLKDKLFKCSPLIFEK
jgi:hypothetical protein